MNWVNHLSKINVNTMFNAMNMKSFNEKKFDQVIATLWIKGSTDDPKKLEMNLILLGVWEAFDWDKDGRQTLDGAAFAEGYFDNEEDQKVYKTSYIDMIPGMDEGGVEDHLGARSLDFVQWLWASLEHWPQRAQQKRCKGVSKMPSANQGRTRLCLSSWSRKQDVSPCLKILLDYKKLYNLHTLTLTFGIIFCPSASSR